MSPAGYSGTPLAGKLGIRAGASLATISAPAHLAELLDPLPAGVRWERDPPIPGGPDGQGARAWDVVVAFMGDRAALEAALPGLGRLIAWEGGLWVAWPKKASSLETDLNREWVRARVLETGLVDNKVCAIDEDWSGLRFVHRLENRPS